MGKDMAKVISLLFTADSYARLATRLHVRIARFLKFDMAQWKKLPAQNTSAVTVPPDPRLDSFSATRNHTPAAVNKSTAASSVVPVTKQLGETLRAALRKEPYVRAGYIHAFNRVHGFGFVTGEDGNTYYLSRGAVVDERLERELNRLPCSTKPVPTHICIRFVDRGKQRVDGYNVAGQVQLDGRN
jgi:hypothetical protein